MIRPNSFNSQLIQQKPRKKINIDIINDKSYNQFEGNSQIDIKDIKDQQNTRTNDFYDNQNKNTKTIKEQINVENQISQYSKIFTLVSKQGLKFKKVDQKNKQNQQDNSKNQKDNQNQKSNKVKVQQTQLKKQQQSTIPQVKFEEGQQEIEELKVQKQQKQTSKVQKANTPKTKIVQQPSSNWKKFMQQSTSSNSKSQSVSVPSKFVSIDCEFVKCGQSDELARISLISEHCQTLYDSYIKPAKKVTDYITDITGITFSHLKNAPSWEQEVSKVKKILMNKILVGHTLHKDLQVCKLTDWKGISQKIDISEFSLYREKNGSKIVSLKRMALSFLNRNIQSGWHSSVEDATVTMDLFKLNKKKMLKEFKII